MRSLHYKRVPETTKAMITETRKTDLPCLEIGRWMRHYDLYLMDTSNN